MIKEQATVIAVNGDEVTVAAQVVSTCNACQAQSDCGTGTIAKALTPKMNELTLRTPVAVKIGQQVTIGVPERGIVTASALLYILPLLFFIGSLVVCQLLLRETLLHHELVHLIMAGALTYVFYRQLAMYLRKLDARQFQPVILPPQGGSQTVE